MSRCDDGYSMDILEQRLGIALVEITCNNMPIQKDKRFYVVEVNKSRREVYSIVPADCPGHNRWNVGPFNEHGVADVARGRTYEIAQQLFSNLVRVREFSYSQLSAEQRLKFNRMGPFAWRIFFAGGII